MCILQERIDPSPLLEGENTEEPLPPSQHRHLSWNGAAQETDGTVNELHHPVYTYNKHMGGVGLLDQMVDHIAAERAYHKFWKCFFALVDQMAFCAYLRHKKNAVSRTKAFVL